MNSLLGKVYAVPSDLNTKMGISLENSGIENYENLNIRFRIRSGDTDDFFKAEAEKIGDFVFLLIRTKTNNMDVLNRERQDFYELEIKTRVRDKENRRIGKSNAEASTIVRVKVKDVNDLDPFFQPSSYAFTVAEDTPLHQVGKIIIMSYINILFCYWMIRNINRNDYPSATSVVSFENK